jgi:hypothetical protein
MIDETLMGIREQNEQLLAAARRTQLELLSALEEAATALAASQEALAEQTEVEWLSRLLRAQAIFTRELAGASAKSARELLETT